MSKVTVTTLKDLVPKRQRSMITEDLVKQLNEWNEDPKLLDSYRENLLTYIGVLKDGKYKITDYVNAVRFVSYKLMGYSDIDAYAVTFPERYERLRTEEGLTRDEISPYTSAYKKNKLVSAIYEQTIIPVSVLNNHMAQDALNELMKIGLHGRSEMARVNALSKVLDKTDAPEIQKLQLDVGVNSSDSLSDLKNMLAEVAADQLGYIEKGRVDLQTLGALKPNNPEEVIEGEIYE